MANSPATEAFRQQWKDEIYLKLEEGMKSRLRDTTDVQEEVRGSTFTFPVLGTVAATQKTNSYDEFTQVAPDRTPATATLADWDVGIWLAKRDLQKANELDSFRAAYTTKLVQAINRRLDLIIVAALDAATPGTVIADGGTGLTPDKLNSAMVALDENAGIYSDEMARSLIATPKGFGQALANTEITSADFMSMQNLVRGDVNEAYGMSWVKSAALSVNTNIASNYAVIQDSVGLAIGDDVSLDMGWFGPRKSFFVYLSLSAGAVVKDANGIVEVQTDQTV